MEERMEQLMRDTIEMKQQLKKLSQKVRSRTGKTTHGATTTTSTAQRTKRLSKVMKARRNSHSSTQLPVVDPEQVHVDEATGRRYSVNTITGESVWIDEEGEGSASSLNKPEKSAVSKRQSFKQFNGETGTYYQNVETGDTVWEVPKGGEIVEM